MRAISILASGAAFLGFANAVREAKGSPVSETRWILTISPMRFSRSLRAAAKSRPSPRSIPISDLMRPTGSTAAVRARKRSARRASDRPQDRLHQPDHLGGIRCLCADLGLCLRPHGPGPDKRAARGFAQRTGRTAHRAGDRLWPRGPARAGHGRSGSYSLHRLDRSRLRDRAVDLPELVVSGRPTPSPPTACTAGFSSDPGIRLACGATTGRASSPASRSIFSETEPGSIMASPPTFSTGRFLLYATSPKRWRKIASVHRSRQAKS